MNIKMADPWARYEAWRHTKSISRNSNAKKMFPGLLLGTAAFVVAVGIEKVMGKKNH